MKKIKLIALLAAIVTGIGIYQLLTELSRPAEVPHRAAVVAAVDIKENTLITADMIRLQDIAEEALLPGCMTDPADVTGMVLSSDVYAGEQILSERLVVMGESSARSDTLAYVIKEGMRAVSISVNETAGLSPHLKPGNHVDLILTYNKEEEEPEAGSSDGRTQVPENAAGEESGGEKTDRGKTDPGKERKTVPASRMLLQDIEILAVGSVISRDVSGELSYGTLTLQTTIEDAMIITLAERTGSIRLLLRSPLDNGTGEFPEMTTDTVTGGESW